MARQSRLSPTEVTVGLRGQSLVGREKGRKHAFSNRRGLFLEIEVARNGNQLLLKPPGGGGDPAGPTHPGSGGGGRESRGTQK